MPGQVELKTPPTGIQRKKTRGLLLKSRYRGQMHWGVQEHQESGRKQEGQIKKSPRITAEKRKEIAGGVLGCTTSMRKNKRVHVLQTKRR